MKHVVAILDTMWGGEPGEAPRYFKINPNNHSGRRLYTLVGDAQLTVTNACRERVTSAKEHGTPDPDWLAENLIRLYDVRLIDVLLVCGKVAQATYKAACPEGGWFRSVRVIYVPHPAARQGWTKEYIARIKQEVQS